MSTTAERVVSSVESCTTILAGKAATLDGSVIMATSCDGNLMGRVYALPAAEYPGQVQMYFDTPAPSTWKAHRDQVEILSIFHGRQNWPEII